MLRVTVLRCFGHLPDTKPVLPKPRASSLETATARRRLAVRKKPFWITISPGIALGYRRNASAGTWSVRSTDGHGREWIKRLALTDDLEPADGRSVLTYWQALDLARATARRTSGEGEGDRPVTVAEAIDLYEADLRARGGDPRNASQVRGHVPAALATRLVGVLTATELKRWRNGLLAKGMIASSVNRTRTRLRAALNLVATHDERIGNSRAWKIGLANLPDAHRARDVALTDTEVLRLIECARAIDPRFGLYVETLAVTGARASQAARLIVTDLQVDRLMMPTSRKGKARKVIRHSPVPIPAGLAAALAAEARGRPGGAPLLRHPDGDAWGHSDAGSRQRRLFRDAVLAAGLDPEGITPYALRHASIVRQLQRNVPIRLVASAHDTSVAMIERSYSAYIAHHGDEIVRAALLDAAVPAAANVVSLPGRRP
jgi:integrase